MPDRTLEQLGWDDDWASTAEAAAAQGRPGRVVRQDRGWVQVATSDGIEAARTREDRVGTPVVGDWIVLDDEPDDVEVGAVLDRRNELRRADPVGEGAQVLAANLDRVLIVAGLDRPVKAGRLQRAIVQSHDADAEPIIVLTKADVVDEVDGARATVAAEHPGVDVIAVSAHTSAGIDALLDRLRGTTVLLGESGAGKSSLLNAFGGSQLAEIGDVREGDSKGRHTTTRRELHRLIGGGLVVDTPGVRAIGLFAEPESIDAAFPDVTEHAGDCRFADCTHDREPGCAVVVAVEGGRVDAARLAAYRDLRDELAWAQRPDHERRGRGAR